MPTSSPAYVAAPPSDQELPFLQHYEADSDEKTLSNLKGRSRIPSSWALVFHLSLVSIYTFIFLYELHFGTKPVAVPSPANTAIKYERQTFLARVHDNPFTGEPRPELDAAWHDLLRYSHIRVTEQELRAANYTSLIFQDGTGYVAQLAVTHQLHCIEHYFPEATESDLEAQAIHVDHCLEILRLAVMCKADTSLTPFYFARTKEGLIYPFVKSKTYHRCVDWELLRAWSAERSVDLFDPSLLRLPPGGRLLEVPASSMTL